MSLQNSKNINLILNAPVPFTLYKLALPNIFAVFMYSAVTFSEAWYIGQISIDELASLALVFPFVSLIGMMGLGAIGGGITSSLSRAIGKNDEDFANKVVWHSLLLMFFLSLIFLLIFVLLSNKIFNLVGAEENVINRSVLFCKIFFSFAPVMFFSFLLVSIFRGCGAYQNLAKITIFTNISQVVLSGVLTLGWSVFPQLGLLGIAISTIICQAISSAYMFIYIIRNNLNVSFKVYSFEKNIIYDILRVGGVSAINSICITLTMIVITFFISKYGTAAIAGHGICLRLEQMLIPLAFGVGGVLTTIVGVNFGAKKYIRAKNFALTGAIIIGLIGTIVGVFVAIFPDLWINIFTGDKEAYAIAAIYLMIVGPVFGIFSGGKTLYFASMGTGKMIIPISAAITRLFIVLCFGMIVSYFSLDIKFLFIGVALGLSVIGIILYINMFSKAWNPI
ncbi:MAG: hypothetical protein CL740_00350 [Chloroflexi bacterium]|nr:hypothetical protein [Chloroflexota bacterium]|tara:strand:+ start:10449 stop:11798 length:1350 start_codon:yes stop_codon:yes gene_type:complete